MWQTLSTILLWKLIHMGVYQKIDIVKYWKRGLLSVEEETNIQKKRDMRSPFLINRRFIIIDELKNRLFLL